MKKLLPTAFVGLVPSTAWCLGEPMSFILRAVLFPLTFGVAFVGAAIALAHAGLANHHTPARCGRIFRRLSDQV